MDHADHEGMQYLSMLDKSAKVEIEITDPCRIGGKSYAPGDKMKLERNEAADMLLTCKARIQIPGSKAKK